MKARLKGSNDEFKEVISLKRNLVELSDAHVYHIYRLEFEPDRWQEPCKLNPEKNLSNQIDHWQDVRERAAIAILQAMVTNKDFQRYSAQYKSEMAITHADALVEKLKEE